MKQYEYKIPRLPGILLTIILLPASWFGYHNAVNHENVSRRGSQLLSGTSATYFWGITAFIFLLLAIFGIFIFLKSFGEPKKLILDDDEITGSPSALSNKIISIPYHEITEFKVTNASKTRQLLIKSPQGKITVADTNFEYKSDFDEIVRTISQKVRT